MDQRISQACSKLVGTSYEEMDCWEAVVSFYMEAYGVKLEQYYGDQRPEREQTREIIRSNVGKFQKVEAPVPGDLILMKVRGIESHIGIYLSPQTFFHSTKGIGASIERLSKWDKMIVGYYRHVGVAA